MDENLHVGRSHIIHLSGLDFTFLYSLGDRFDEASCSLTVWNLADDQSLVVELVYLGTNFQHTATLTIIVFAYINGTTRREIRIKREWFALQIVNGSIAEIIEVVGQHLAAQAYGDTFCALCKEQRKFGRQGDRLFIAAVV